jgi:hypothetical protein
METLWSRKEVICEIDKKQLCLYHHTHADQNDTMCRTFPAGVHFATFAVLFSETARKQRKNSGHFAVISIGEQPTSQDFRGSPGGVGE